MEMSTEIIKNEMNTSELVKWWPEENPDNQFTFCALDHTNLSEAIV